MHFESKFGPEAEADMDNAEERFRTEDKCHDGKVRLKELYRY